MSTTETLLPPTMDTAVGRFRAMPSAVGTASLVGGPSAFPACRATSDEPNQSVEALLLDLLAGRIAATPRLEAVARRGGLSPNRSYCAAVIGAADPSINAGQLAVAVWRLGLAARTVLYNDGWLVRGLGPTMVLVTILAGEPEAARERLRRCLQTISRRFVGGNAFVIGLGTARAGLDGIVGSFQEARYALAVGPLAGQTSPIDFAQLGFYQVLAPGRQRDDLVRFRDRILGALLSQGRHRAHTMVETLAAYFACECQAGAAATHLGIHRNTVAYRLARTRALTGLDVHRQNESFLIQTALHVHRLLESDVASALGQSLTSGQRDRQPDRGQEQEAWPAIDQWFLAGD